MNKSQMTILIADDDAEDRLMIQEAFQESEKWVAEDSSLFTAETVVETHTRNSLQTNLPTKTHNKLYFVENGEEVIDYLRRQGRYSEPGLAPRPSLIILDLNMPKKDGYEVLSELKSNPDYRGIPVVILTTSRTDEDINRTYSMGVNSFIEKPVNFDGLVKIAKNLKNYWFSTVHLPSTSLR